jgi:hypothetical protein
MKLSERESALLLATLAVGLFGVSFILGRPKVREWNEIRARRAVLREEIALDRGMVAQRGEWEARFKEVSGMLSRHPADQKMDIHWMTIMDRAAARHGIGIKQRQAGEERRAGEVYELPIEVKEWGGTLDALVHFLFDLQGEGAMLDVRQLLVKPMDGGILRGRFVLYCAYTREET